jgi:signal transduction histidine kinase
MDVSIRRAWVLFAGILAVAAAAAVAAQYAAHAAWAERIAYEWLRNTWDQGVRAYEAGVIDRLRADAEHLATDVGELPPARRDDASAFEQVFHRRHPNEHWIIVQGERVTSSLAACEAPEVATILRARREGLLACGDLPLLVAAAPAAGGDAPLVFVGRVLDDAHAAALHLVTGAEVVLVSGGRTIATSYRDRDGARIDPLGAVELARVASLDAPSFEIVELATPGYAGYTAASEPILAGAPGFEAYVFATPLPTLAGRGRVEIVLSAPRAVLEDGVGLVSLATGGFSAVMAALVLLAGRRFVRRFERTLQQMTVAADQIGQGASGVRVGALAGGGELDRLGATLDAMASRLERLHARQQATAAAAEARAIESAQALEVLRRAHDALQETQAKLVDASRLAGMAEVATNVLHNVGNVLNTVNVAADLARRRVRESRLPTLERIVTLVPRDAAAAAAFLADDPRGRQVPQLLRLVAEALRSEHDDTSRELDVLSRSVDHIKSVVRGQQEVATFRGGVELVAPSEVLDVAIALQGVGEHDDGIELVRDYVLIEPMLLDRHRTMQILLNLLANARQAIRARGGLDGCIVVRLARQGDDLRIEVSDDGIGIAPELRDRIFQHGFTTRRDGHGFGLHSSANAAVEMGGALTVHSNGLGSGATFVLSIPAVRRDRHARPRTGDAPPDVARASVRAA